jgi:two-component system nitrate/nitrite response regulator NarL
MVTVVIADDHPVYRDGIVRALLDTGRYRIEAEASDGSTAAELIEARRPDIALLDLGMPGRDGLAALDAIVVDAGRIRGPGLKSGVERSSTGVSARCGGCR